MVCLGHLVVLVGPTQHRRATQPDDDEKVAEGIDRTTLALADVDLVEQIEEACIDRNASHDLDEVSGRVGKLVETRRDLSGRLEVGDRDHGQSAVGGMSSPADAYGSQRSTAHHPDDLFVRTTGHQQVAAGPPGATR
jgi:hypothetical protein